MFSRGTPEFDQQPQAGQRCGTGTGGNEFDLLQVLAHHLQSIEQAAPTTMAVPCWSSWNTGIFMRSRSLRST
jgi:hypothetical protein